MKFKKKLNKTVYKNLQFVIETHVKEIEYEKVARMLHRAHKQTQKRSNARRKVQRADKSSEYQIKNYHKLMHAIHNAHENNHPCGVILRTRTILIATVSNIRMLSRKANALICRNN
jgi:hypothetical protein